MRLLRAAFLPVSMGILIWACFAVPLPQYVQRPGAVVALGPAVHIEDPRSGELRGDFHLTTINLRRATTFDYMAAVLSENVGTTAASNVIPNGARPSEYFARQRQVFRDSGLVAAAVGLCAADFYEEPCRLTGDGALIAQVVEGSAAEGVLAAGDIVIRADGRVVATDADLRDTVAETAPDEVLELVVLRDGEELLLEAVPRVVPDLSDEPLLGVSPSTFNPRIDQPVPVEIESGRIGGPSAGLMIALAVFDKVNAEVDLAAGRSIAGTGTIDTRGAVGPVGGVRFKVVAAHRAGADLFLFPAALAEVALAALPAGSDVVIVPVETFDEAVAQLRGPLDEAG